MLESSLASEMEDHSSICVMLVAVPSLENWDARPDDGELAAEEEDTVDYGGTHTIEKVRSRRRVLVHTPLPGPFDPPTVGPAKSPAVLEPPTYNLQPATSTTSYNLLQPTTSNPPVLEPSAILNP